MIKEVREICFTQLKIQISSVMISQLTEEGYGPWPEIFKEQVSLT